MHEYMDGFSVRNVWRVGASQGEPYLATATTGANCYADGQYLSRRLFIGAVGIGLGLGRGRNLAIGLGMPSV
jgi:hypothetical protein